MKLLLYPAAFMANIFSMTFVMIGLALFGKPELAADFGIVHGATVALIFALSGNARSLILSRSKEINATAILQVRFLFLLPLGICAYYLSTTLTAIPASLAALLVWRRVCEWLAEVFLSEHESAQHRQVPVRFVAAQAVTMLLVLVWLVLDLPLQNCVLFLWGIAPLFGCLRLQTVSGALRSRGVFRPAVLYLLPHFGSTTVIGVSVYVFRLFLVLLIGKSVAGDLFSAFALGGIFGSILAQALGPTLAMHSLPKESRIHRLIRSVSLLSVALGLVLIAVAMLLPQLLAWTRKSEIFWVAVGLSLIGGVVMAQAQQLRYRILLHSEHKDVFGADVLSNILLISLIPILYHVAGTKALIFLYLISALLIFLFYCHSEMGLFMLKNNFLRYLIEQFRVYLPFLILLPLFFQFGHGIFNSQDILYDSHGQLSLLPIPLSVITCCLGILVLGGFSKSRLSLSIIFITFLGMLFSSSIFIAHGEFRQGDKLTLLVQYIIPMLALVLGQTYGRWQDALNNIAKSFLLTVLIVVPVETIVTVYRGDYFLSPSILLFSVYQQLQYVPVILVAAFVLSIFTLWEIGQYKLFMFLASVFIGFYSIMSLSELATGLLVMGVAGFAVCQWYSKNCRLLAVLMVSVIITSMAAGGVYAGSHMMNKLGITVTHISHDATIHARVPDNISQRYDYWKFYCKGISENWTSMLFGHPSAPDRYKIPSAHNYYLDFAYNFGVLSTLPFLWLIVYNIRCGFRHRQSFLSLDRNAALAGVVAFLLFADNMFKVGMRQPYPGIVTFFLWGILLSALMKGEKQ